MAKPGGTQSPRHANVPTLGILLSLIYLAFELIYSGFAFTNFPIFQVIGTVITLSIAPLALLFYWLKRYSFWSAPSWGQLAGVVAVALAIFMLRVSSLVTWVTYATNFPNQRIEAGGSYHHDTAFHVAIVQKIMSHGIPSTGQHMEPLLGYHTLSHFADTAVLRLLGMDPWVSYALMFNAKGIALCLGLIYFITLTFRNLRLTTFWVGGPILVWALTGEWRIVGSHGEWLPMLILFLTAPWVYEKLSNAQRGLKLYLALSLLVVFLSFGKVSLGFGFAVFVGFWLMRLRPLSLGVLSLGAVWILFFALVAGQYAGQPAEFELGWQHFAMVYGEMTSLLMFLGALLLIRRYRKNGPILDALKALSLGLLSVVIVTSVAAGNSTDTYYFFHGFFTVAALLLTPVIANTFATKNSDSDSKSVRTIGFRSDLALSASFVLISSPIIAFAPPHELGSFARTVGAASAVTYYWNAELSDEPANSQGLLERTMARFGAEVQPTYFDAFSSAISDLLEENQIPRGDSLLFISAEGFETIAARAQPRYSWSTGLLVTAITGITLAYSVDPSHPAGNYGFNSYDESSHRRDYDEESLTDVCSFGRPVIIANDLESLRFSVHCTTS